MLDLKEQHINVEIRLALDMAVKALKAQEEGRLIEGDCEHCFNTYGTLGCCSTVSNKWIYNCKSGMKEYAEALKAQEWIPCSERLPNSQDYTIKDSELKGYLIQTEYGNMLVAYYIKKKDGMNIITERWYTTRVGIAGSIVSCDVVAWMPLPPKYKPEGEDKE